MISPAQRRLLTVAAVLNAFTYAIIVFFIGITLPNLSAIFALSESQKGSLFLVQNLASLATILGVGPVIERIGRKPVMTFGLFLIAGGVAAAGFAASFPMLLLFLFFLGIGGGCTNVAGSALMTDLYPENPGPALNIVGAGFGAGAICVPLLSSFLLDNIGLRGLTLMYGGIALVPFALFLVGKFPKVESVVKFSLQNSARILLNPLVFFVGLVLFFYVALEISTAGWSKDYFIRRFQMSDSDAGLVLAGFSLMMFSGRALAGWILRKIANAVLVLICTIAAILGLIIMLKAATVSQSIAGLLVVGLAFAPIFPTSLGTIGQNFHSNVPTIFGVATAMGSLGSVLLPFFIGLLGGNLSVMMLAAVLMMAAQVMVLVALKKKYKGHPPDAALEPAG